MSLLINQIKALPNETKDDGGETSTMSSTVGSKDFNEVLKLSHAVERIKLNSGSTFKEAFKRFEEARRRAIEALSIDTLSIEDIIFARKLQILYQILERLDNPEEAIVGCLPALQTLHSLSAIQDIFNVSINGGVKFNEDEYVENVKSVMLINHVLSQYVVKFSSKNPVLQRWPTIRLPESTFHPISQWTKVALRKSMGNKLELHRDISTSCASVNSHSEVITVAPGEHIQFISTKGECETVELPDPKEFTVNTVEGLAVDKNDKVYMIRGLETQTELGTYVLSIMNEDNNVISTCLLDFLKEIPVTIAMVINKNNDIIISPSDDPYVYICDNVGQLKHKFETGAVRPPTLAINEKNEIITCGSKNVKLYTEEGHPKSTIKLPEGHKCMGAAFHHVIWKIIVLTRRKVDDRTYFLLSYSESGELETAIPFHNNHSWIYPTIKSHPSGPVVLLTAKGLMFI